MAIRLDQVPAKALRPAPPRIWLWLGLLVVFLLAGAGGMLAFGTPELRETPSNFWGLALGVPLLAWSVVGFGGALFYIGLQRAADGWDEAREEALVSNIRRGRRSQQVLSVSVFTGLREPGQPSAAQLDALLERNKAQKAQATPLPGTSSGYSRLPFDLDEDPEDVLLRVLVQLLAELGQTLSQVPDDRPLALLLEVNSGLPEKVLRRLWQQAWNESGIRQSATPVDGSGLAALDHWLDHRITDQALLLVVAVQFAPQQPEGSAEAVVGMLLGNRLTQNTLPALAYVHRPEEQREPTTEALLRATDQALDWVQLDGNSIVRAWRSGVDTQHDVAVNTALGQMPSTQGLCNLDSVLGHPGAASPWLAIAAATQTIQRGAGPQIIFSGGSSGETGLWSTVLIPVPPHSTKES
ncbi:MAG: hypothetical protein ACOH2R_19660 [Pseudomonas sp.]